MRTAALFSGGKDSLFSIYRAMKQGHEIVTLITIMPKRHDSYMYHVPNVHLTEYGAQAMDLPLIEKESSGKKEKELEDLKEILKDVKKELKIEGVISGANASRYQSERIAKICDDLKMKSITPMWQEDEETLIKEMIDLGFKIIIVGVGAGGLDENWLGKMLDEKALEELKKLKEKFGISLVGEGGEFETFVIDSPLFKKKIKIIETEKKWQGSWGELKIKKAELVKKN